MKGMEENKIGYIDWLQWLPGCIYPGKNFYLRV